MSDEYCNAVWGSVVLTEYRVGTDGAFYQLRTSRTDGVRIVRYAFAAAAPAPPSNVTTVQPAPTSQPAVTVPAAPADNGRPAGPRPASGRSTTRWPRAG